MNQDWKVKPELLLLFLTASVTATDASAAQLIPLRVLAELPKFSHPMVSPNGKYLAATMTVDGQPMMVVQNLLTSGEEREQELVPIDSGENFFYWYRWVNNDRLVFSLRSTTMYRFGLVNRARVGSIGRDGRDSIFFAMQPNLRDFYRAHPNVVDFLENDPDHILAALDDEPTAWATPQVHLVNINTGHKKLLLSNRRGVYAWIADGDGVIRIGTKIDTKYGKRNVTVFYRETASDGWETLQKVDYFDHDRLEPWRFDEDDANILLMTSANLQDEQDPNDIEDQLFRYDLSIRKIIGAYENSHRKNVIKTVEQALPDLEVKIVSRDKEKNIYFFRVFSDVKSPEYFMLDIRKRTLDYVAAEYPDLHDYELAPMERISYKARDGLDIPAFLTIPVGAERKNLPVVVYPHGGPWARDRWGFDNYVQFMANRGYAVFQPQFRGSTGYGIEHEEAGYGEWGYGIQDDITDGVEWLIDQGIADPGRICIVGSSFGGYAAAMGVAKTPDLYRCAVSINGVLDLKMFIDSGRYLLFKTINRAIWNDRADAENASPHHMADRIQVPLLLMGSERDTVVPVRHSERMFKKLKRLDKPVTYIELPDGEHWRTNEANEIIKFQALEKFLAEHIGSKRPIETGLH